MSPGRIAYEDLPATARRELAGADRPTTPARTATAPLLVSTPARWRCHTCSKEFVAGGRDDDSWAAAERHSDEQGHARIDFVLEELAC